MTSELTLLTKENFGGIELNFYRNTENEIFMTAKQLGEALEYANPVIAINKMVSRNERLKKEEFSVLTSLVSTDGKAYETRIFTEDGLYELTMLSKQPKAEEFRDFIRKLLKGLRKNEIKIMETSPSYLIEDPIARAEQWIVEQKEKLALEETINEYKPKVDYYNTILSSTDTVNITQIAKDYGMSGRRLNQLLNEERVQYKIGGQWMLYQKYADKGYTRTHTHSYDREDGTTGTNLQTKWTQKGRLLIHNILTDKGYVAEMDKEKESE